MRPLSLGYFVCDLIDNRRQFRNRPNKNRHLSLIVMAFQRHLQWKGQNREKENKITNIEYYQFGSFDQFFGFLSLERNKVKNKGIKNDLTMISAPENQQFMELFINK